MDTQIINQAIQSLTERSNQDLFHTKSINLVEKDLAITQILGTPLTEKTFNKGIHFLKVDKNIVISEEKAKMMFQILSKDFTEESFIQIVGKVLRTKTYNELTISDFYNEKDILPKFHTRKWYLEELHKNPSINDYLECYLEVGTNNEYYKEKGGLMINDERFRRLW